MTDKEFRHLRRTELIEIIYRLQENEAALQEEVAALKEQLETKELNVAEAGSIADAAMKLNSVFESAQAAADQYVTEVRRTCAGMEIEAAQTLLDAQAQAAEVLSNANRQSDEMLAEAEKKRDAVLVDAAKQQAEAEDQRAALLAEAQATHDELISKAEQEVSQKWTDLNEKVQRTVSTYAELRSIMESLQERR